MISITMHATTMMITMKMIVTSPIPENMSTLDGVPAAVHISHSVPILHLLIVKELTGLRHKKAI